MQDGSPDGSSADAQGDQTAGASGNQGGEGLPPGGVFGGQNPAGGNGPLTPAEEVAILDAELERGTGDFDSMILDTQQEQRERQRESAGASRGNGPSPDASSGAASSGEGAGESELPEYEPVAHAGGATGRGDAPPAGNAAVYSPPDDIPSADDDDVVARQLRELAMSEPDPVVRERLWDEYRKYKGIDP